MNNRTELSIECGYDTSSITKTNLSTSSITTSPSSLIYNVASSNPFQLATATNITRIQDCVDIYDIFYLKILRMISSYLTENELSELINTIKYRVRDEEKETLKEFVKTLVKTRHFSEEFILNNIEYLTKEDIEKMHEADICSGAYEQLKLMFIAGN